MIKNFINDNKFEYYKDTSLKNYNTYKLDTICKYLIFPKTREELIKLIKYLKENNCKYIVLGNGSNVIFADDYYDGIVIKLDHLNKLTINKDIVEVEAGYSVIKLAMDVALMGLSGLEFASGIPGSIASSVAMNAGAYNDSLSEILISVEVLTPNHEIITMTNSELDFRYRHSFFKDNKDYIIISCKLKLNHGDKKEILNLISQRRIRRIESQPLNYPSAGSVFRNPEGMHAGALIEKCGLKGHIIGGAQISKKHANFIVNYNNATGKDIIALINKAKKEVKKKYHVDLILEQIIID